MTSSRPTAARPALLTRTVARILPVLLLVTGVQVLEAAHHPRQAAAATATGVGGRFVSVQSSLLDTATGVGGYSTPMPAGTWRTVTVAGRAGLPSSGVAAVQVAVTAVDPDAAGIVSLRPKSGVQSFTALVYHQGSVSGSVSNTAVVAVTDAGTIDVQTQTSLNLQIDVQGYYTSGNPSAGGFVPVAAARTVNTSDGTGLSATGPLAAGSDTVLQVGGVAGVPVGASAAFVNFTVSGSAVGGSLVPYPTGDPMPDVSLTFMPSVTTSIGTAVPLNSSGQLTVHLASSASLTVTMDVLGYFTAATGQGAFTPAAVRLVDSYVAPATAIPANGTVTVQVTGVHGVPAAGSGISAIAANVHIRHTNGTNPGYARVWAADAAEPATANDLTYDARSTLSNLFTTTISADGAIKIHNASADPVGYAVDLEGWFTTLGSVTPAGQDRTQERITLQANAPGTANYVTYRYRVGTKGAFTNVPVADVTVPGTATHPSGWPLARNAGGTFDPYTWDLGVSVGHADKLVQVQACLGTSTSDPNPLCSMPSNVTLESHAFGDSHATTPMGPGTLALLTGDYSLSATDVSAGSYRGALSLGRTLTTLSPAAASTAAAGVFGPGWTADLAGPGAGQAGMTLAVSAATGYLTLTDTDGSAAIYQAVPGSGYPVAYTGVGDAAAAGASIAQADATHLTVTDADGTVTAWTAPGGTWTVTSVSEPGSNAATTYTYDTAALVTRILAPVPAGVTCAAPDTTPGCRSLTLTYTSIAGARRLTAVNLVAYDPQTAAMTTTTVAAYDYTAGGLLADGYDPRISPLLKTAYTYDSNARLATLTPPGLAPYTFGYDSAGRLSTVSRYDAANTATAVSTVVYGVAFTGTGAPLDLSAAASGGWGQGSDVVATATAVFGPDHQPAATTAGAVPAADWPYADLHYLDVNGRETNTAVYGAGTWQYGASTYDSNGNTVRTLSPGNRAQALTPTPDTDPTVAALPAAPARADQLAATTVYDPLDPSRVSDAYGPTHPFTSAGATLHGRAHTATSYDEGAPTGAAITGLPTTTTTASQSADGVDHDPATTRTGYAALVAGDPTGWSLGLPTSSTTVGARAGGGNLTRATRYNAAGQTIENRQPASTGSDAGTRLTTYYTATGTGPCVAPALAGLPCSVGPAAQPTTGNPLPTTTYTYDRYTHPLTATETAAGTTRTTTLTYDDAERPTASALTVTPAGDGGTPVPPVTTTYDTTTGIPSTQSTASATLSSTYDTLGRLATYTDAGATTTTNTYDLAGRLVARNDGKATSTWTYDSASEHRGIVTAENVGGTPVASAGAFTATTNPDGQPDTLTYPGGMTARTRYDNTGTPTTLTYTASGSTWAQFTQTTDAQGRTGTQTSQQSAQTFGYDTAGRLTTVADTVTTGSTATCTTRAYALDANSNRTSLKTYPDDAATPATGHCTTTTTPLAATSTYDNADRLTNAGYSYDTLGRTLTVPAADSTGTGAHTATTGAMTIGYYANDMVNTQTQGGATTTYTLDPTLARIATQTTGGVTTTDHYTGAGDSPAWTATSSSAWTRNLTGPTGGLVGTQTPDGTPTLRIANLHGDLVATLNTTNTGLTNYTETTEYGTPRTPAAADTTYGYLGTAQRSTDTLGGVILMGVRLYNPSTGRFLQTDPIYGGSANAYDYCTADPINCTDLDGRFGWRNALKLGAMVGGIAAAVACGASVVCGVAVGVVAGAASYSAANAGTEHFRWRGVATEAVIGGVLGRLTARGYLGGGNEFKVGRVRIGSGKWIGGKGRPWYTRLPHYHRGATQRLRKFHRPWQDGF